MQLMYGTLGILVIIKLCLPSKTYTEVVDSMGNTKLLYISEVEYILPLYRVIVKKSYYKSFGRLSKLRLNPQFIPNLKWELTVTVYIHF